MAAAVDAQITAQQRLRALAMRLAGDAWDRLPNYDEASVAPFLAVVVPLVAAAQRQSIGLSDAYVARALGRPALGIDPVPVIDDLRGATAPADVYRRPFVQAWTDLADGRPWEDVVPSARARLQGSVALDVQIAQRAGLQAVQDRDRRILGWRRVADAGACGFCRLVDGAYLRTAVAMALHVHCGCSIEPRTVATEPSPVPGGVAVHEHGELGLTLADPAHAFTGPGDLP